MDDNTTPFTNHGTDHPMTNHADYTDHPDAHDHAPDHDPDFIPVAPLTPLAPLVPHGRAANGVFWQNLFASVPDLEAELEDLALSGDEIIGRVTYRGTHTGGAMGIPPTGEAIVLREVDIWNISDRILGNRWVELAELPLFRQLGAAARNMSDESAP